MDQVRAGWRLLRVALVPSAVSLVLGAPSVLSWSERVADPALSVSLYRIAFRWDHAMARLGLDAPYRLVRAAERRTEALRFGSGAGALAGVGSRGDQPRTPQKVWVAATRLPGP